MTAPQLHLGVMIPPLHLQLLQQLMLVRSLLCKVECALLYGGVGWRRLGQCKPSCRLSCFAECYFGRLCPTLELVLSLSSLPPAGLTALGLSSSVSQLAKAAFGKCSIHNVYMLAQPCRSAPGGIEHAVNSGPLNMNVCLIELTRCSSGAACGHVADCASCGSDGETCNYCNPGFVLSYEHKCSTLATGASKTPPPANLNGP